MINKKASFNFGEAFLLVINGVLSDESIRRRNVIVDAELNAGKACLATEQIPRSRRWSEDRQIRASVAVEINLARSRRGRRVDITSQSKIVITSARFRRVSGKDGFAVRLERERKGFVQSSGGDVGQNKSAAAESRV